MSPAHRDHVLRGGRADDSNPLPGLTASRAGKLAAGWEDRALWDDVAWLGERFWTSIDPVDRAVRWHHVVVAVGNFKRPRARWLRPCGLSGIPGDAVEAAGFFETPAGLRVDRDDRASWEALRASLGGADVSTTTYLLAALWPRHHFMFNWRVRDAASALRMAADLEPCPGVLPSITGGDSSALDFDDYTVVRLWLGALDSPLVVSQRALYCLSHQVESEPSRPWPEYAQALVSILEGVDEAEADSAD